MKQTFEKPRIVVSACLLSAKCRWDGDTISDQFVTKLKRQAKLIPVCPEIEIGLGIPRDPIRLVKNRNKTELYQLSNKLNLTKRMTDFSRKYFEDIGEIDGIILKSKSPTCGIQKVKLFDSREDKAEFERNGVGLFASEALNYSDQVVVASEVDLQNANNRERFLTSIFMTAAFRKIGPSPTQKKLLAFQELYSSILIALGITKNKTSKLSYSAYSEILYQSLQLKQNAKNIHAIFENALDHYRDDLSSNDIERFESNLNSSRLTIETILKLRATVLVWAVRYDRAWVREQAFFNPYPPELNHT